MSKRHLIIIDITGRQSEDKDAIVKTIRALHNIAFGYNYMSQVGIEDEMAEKLHENEIVDQTT